VFESSRGKARQSALDSNIKEVVEKISGV